MKIHDVEADEVLINILKSTDTDIKFLEDVYNTNMETENYEGCALIWDIIKQRNEEKTQKVSEL